MEELNIITTRPVSYSIACGCEGSSSLDGSSGTNDVLNFQKWVSVSDMATKDKSIKDIKLDGKWGPKTAKLYKSFGKQYEEAQKRINTKSADTGKSKDQIMADATAKMLEDEKNASADKRVKYMKIGGAIVGSLVLIGIIYAIVKK